ncbi:MAG: hypothetical protein OEZ19_08860, partial [Paracoccaceae bacterium]|nr:hypothetical protein [Paracoccaceae bacterium]
MTKPTSGTFSRRPIVLMLFMLGLFWAGSLVLFQNGASSDLFALWLAADAFGSGQLQSIYPPAGEVFLMHPPLSWVAEAQALGQPGPYFPYIYPPLFAALLSPATEVMNFAQFQTVFSYVNAFLLCGTIPLAMRASRLDMAPVAYLAIAIGLSS